jgi:osmoprotectant transport system substrate-binding protein
MLALGAVVLALIVSACTPGGGSASPSASESEVAKPAVTIGSAGFYEAALVAEIYAQALEAQGYTVTRKLELGERDVTQAAIESEEIDLKPEYLGGMASFLGAEVSSDAQETFDNLQAALAAKDLAAFDFSPGTNADGFAVRQETAEEFELETMSDLAEVADQLIWGLAPGCPDNPVCGPGLLSTYGIDISQLDVESGLQPCSTQMAEALNNSAIDVAQVCTTQPDIARFNFLLLEDDLGLQPAQNIAPVVRQALLDAAPDDFEVTLNAVTALLTTDVLTQLGVQVAVDQESYADVAAQFLADNGM